MNKIYHYLFILFSGLLLLTGQQANSQTPVLTWGPILQEPAKTYISQIIGSDKTGFYALRSKSFDSGMFLERYDKSNNLVFSKELVMPLPQKSKVKTMRFEGIYYLGGQLVLFSSFLNEKTLKNFAFANRISKDGIIDNAMVEVGVIEGATPNRPGQFMFSLSNDSTKILVFKKLDTKPNEPRKLQYKVLDNKLNTVIAKATALPELSKTLYFKEATVDNDGNVYILIEALVDKEKKATIAQATSLRIQGHFTDNTVKDFDIQVPGKFIRSTLFNIDKNKNFMLAGLLADKNDLDVNSIFFLKTDFSSRKVGAQGIIRFTPELLELFIGSKDASKPEAGIPGLYLEQLVVREDGGAVLVAEHAWVEGSNYNSSGSATTFEYNNGNILLINIKPNASLDWMSVIPKKQQTKNDNAKYNSFSLSIIKDKIYIVYNDHAENGEIADWQNMKPMKNPAKAVTMLVILDSTGKFKRTVLAPAKDQETIARPALFLQGDKSIIMYAEVDRNYRFGTLNLN